jgi:hypothetical protein
MTQETEETPLGQFIFWKLVGCVLLAIGLTILYAAIAKDIVRPFVAAGFGAAFAFVGISLLRIRRKGNSVGS